MPTGLIAQSKKDRDQAKRLQVEADKAYIQKNFKDVAEKYGEALKLVPSNPYGHYKKGFAVE